MGRTPLYTESCFLHTLGAVCSIVLHTWPVSVKYIYFCLSLITVLCSLRWELRYVRLIMSDRSRFVCFLLAFGDDGKGEGVIRRRENLLCDVFNAMSWNKMEFCVSCRFETGGMKRSVKSFYCLMKVLGVVYFRHLLQSILFFRVVMIDWTGMQKSWWSIQKPAWRRALCHMQNYWKY